MNDLLTSPLPSPAGKKGPPPPRIVRALKAFEEAAGGRDKLVAELAPAPLSETEALVLQLLADPDRDRQPLHEILGYAGISVARFLKIFRDARGARAYLDTLDRVWEKLPDVAADVMDKALPKQVACKPCGGTGKQQVHKPKTSRRRSPAVLCPDCGGTGKKDVEPTLDYQRLALALGGLPKAVPSIHIDQSKNQQQNNYFESGTLRDFVSAVSRIKRTPIDVDATVIEDEPVEGEEEEDGE